MLVDGPHFQATNGGELAFLHSDGDSSRRPGEHEIWSPCRSLERGKWDSTTELLSPRPTRAPRFGSTSCGDRKIPCPPRPRQYVQLTPYHNAPVFFRASRPIAHGHVPRRLR